MTTTPGPLEILVVGATGGVGRCGVDEALAHASGGADAGRAVGRGPVTDDQYQAGPLVTA